MISIAILSNIQRLFKNLKENEINIMYQPNNFSNLDD